MSRLRDDDGFTLIELLVAATLMLLLLGAVLLTFDNYVKGNRRNQMLAQDMETGRNAVDLVARDARNATAYQTTANPTASAVLRADPQDFVFKAVNPTASAPLPGNTYRVRTVRYCYVAASQRLLRQVADDAVVPGAACPDPSFTTASSVPDVVNGTRPLFTYDAATPGAVTWARVDLYVDSTPGAAPTETPLHSGVYLRNANRPPQARFTAVATANRHVQLNASDSVDPDGRLLTYTWKDGSTVLTQNGPVVDYVAPVDGTHTFTLTVSDPGGLTDTYQQTVEVLS
jgi:prepilin-type N-terminal cleavage/methylation domain-containing protein